jgi:hypothetical protein
MRLTEQQLYDLYDLAVGEGEAVLLPGPVRDLPSEVPPEWIEVLTTADCDDAAARLWAPLAGRLPRIQRALRERLAAVAYLATERGGVSLLYLFRDGEDLVAYRGRAPLSAADLAERMLPPEIGDLYRLHDGWTLYVEGDLGPLPAGDWVPLAELDLGIDWRLPPGDLAPDRISVMYRDGEDLLLGFDGSRTPALPVLLRADGSADCLLDPWEALDREIGDFLEELDRTAPATPVATQPRAAVSPTRSLAFSTRFRAHQGLASHLGGGAIHRQTAAFLLARASQAGADPAGAAAVLEDRRRGLKHWCSAVELGAAVAPADLIGMFGLAHALGDTQTADFVLTIPAALWDDDSLAAVQVRVLVALGLGDRPLAANLLDELLGLTCDGDQPPAPADASAARLLEALVQRDPAAYATWRRHLMAAWGGDPGSAGQPDLPGSICIGGFDALAARIGLRAAETA